MWKRDIFHGSNLRYFFKGILRFLLFLIFQRENSERGKRNIYNCHFIRRIWTSQLSGMQIHEINSYHVNGRYQRYEAKRLMVKILNLKNSESSKHTWLNFFSVFFFFCLFLFCLSCTWSLLLAYVAYFFSLF